MAHLNISDRRKRAAEKLIHDFDGACRDLAFVGSHPPCAREAIEQRHKEAREVLLAAVLRGC